MVKSTTMSATEMIEYDVNEIAHQNSGEFSATDDSDKEFWRRLQSQPNAGIGPNGLSPEQVADLKKFEDKCKYYNAKHPEKRWRRTLTDTNQALPTLVAPQYSSMFMGRSRTESVMWTLSQSEQWKGICVFY